MSVPVRCPVCGFAPNTSYHCSQCGETAEPTDDALPHDYTVTFSNAEALVLFEYLTRFAKDGQPVIEDQAERRVLWNLLASLEQLLVEPLMSDYGERLARARETTRDELSAE